MGDIGFWGLTGLGRAQGSGFSKTAVGAGGVLGREAGFFHPAEQARQGPRVSAAAASAPPSVEMTGFGVGLRRAGNSKSNRRSLRDDKQKDKQLQPQVELL